jgi:hypothetical protein
LPRPPFFGAIEIAALLDMTRVRQDRNVRYAAKTMRHDTSHFEAVEILTPYLTQEPLHCILHALRSDRTQEHHL